MRTAWLTRMRTDASRWPVIRPVLLCAILLLGGCVTVKAPDKPIEINLYIAVKQEVVVSLKKDAEDFIAGNPDLFPK